jgi:hypothetical protein
MKYIVVAFMLLLAAIPVQAQTATAGQKADMEKAVKEQFLQYFRLIDAMDADTAYKMWTQERMIGKLGSGQLATSVEEMIKSAKTAFANRKAHKFDFQNLTTRVLSQDAVIVVGSGSFRNELKSGNIWNYNYLCTQVWVRQDNAWRLAYMAENSAAKQ